MSINNKTVVERAQEFIQSMRQLTDSASIGADICQHADAQPIADLCAECAKGNASESPVSLTLACGSVAAFDIRGTHAYGTLSNDRRFGAWLMIVLILAVLLIAYILCKS